MQIAIDGPASSGKSTIAKQVAHKLGFIYCDTGAMYRAATVLAANHGLDYHDEAGIMALLANTAITFKPSEAGQQVFLGDLDVTATIREPEATNNVSYVAALPAVREEMVRRQREIAASESIVMDGRDIGTTVLPDAELKVFMIASVQERARRRFKENQEKGIMTPLATLEQEIEARDYKDSHRAVSPLAKAADAITVDTTQMTIDEVVTTIMDLAAKAGA